MTSTDRQEILLDAFAQLADSLVADYEVLDLLQTLVETCAAALDVMAAGILLSNGDGELELVASTSEATSLVETIALGAEAGPCIEAFQTGSVVSVPVIDAGPERWSEFRAKAAEQGIRSVYCIPLKLRDNTIGTLNLFGAEVGELKRGDTRAAQALADVATIGILQERILRESEGVRRQLELALNSRIVIEQAKGVVAHTHGVSTESAFERIRSHARSSRLPIALVARQLVERSLII